MSIEIVVKSPKECSDFEIELFEKMVVQGAEVSLVGLRQRIQHAEKLIFINHVGCVAIGAIKNPNVGYKARLFGKSGDEKEHSKYQFELGWIYVSEVARGRGHGLALMEAIVYSLSGRASFATTREDNASMHHLFGRFGFSRLGRPYQSENGDYSLVLYVKS